MASTVTRPVFGGATGNSYSSTTTQVANAQIRYIDRAIEALDYEEVPLTKEFGMGEAVNNRKVEWYDDRLSPVSDTLGAAYVAAGTTITVTNGVRFQQYDLVKIDSELMLVTGISGNTLTVTTAWGGTANAGHASGATVEILAPALPENIDTPPSPVTRGEAFSNFCQLMDYGFNVSERQDNSAYYTIRGKEYNFEVEKKLREAAIDFERLLFHGVAVDATGALPSAMGGFPAYITTNVTAAAGAQLTKAMIMNALQAMFTQVGPANMGKLLVMNATQKRIFSNLWSVNRQLNDGQTQATEIIERVSTEFGLVRTMMHYWAPNDAIYFINPKNYQIRPFAGYGRWHDEPLAKSGPYRKGHVVGDYTLVAKGNRASAKITGISTTLGL